MDEGETLEHLRKENERLKRENELLKAKILELEARLAQYENAHTPPSLRRGRNRKRDLDKRNNGTPGQKSGHKGTTRPSVMPHTQVDVTADHCPDCGTKLGNPIRIESKIVEEIPQPRPIMVTEYKVAHYRCPHCNKEVVATNPDCPREGKFGNNAIALATTLKYKDRLPHRKVQDALTRLYGLKLSPATILDLTRRASDAVLSEYNAILSRIRGASILYVDETSIHVQGETHWIWAFTTPSETLFVMWNKKHLASRGYTRNMNTDDSKYLKDINGVKTDRIVRTTAEDKEGKKMIAESCWFDYPNAFLFILSTWPEDYYNAWQSHDFIFTYI